MFCVGVRDPKQNSGAVHYLLPQYRSKLLGDANRFGRVIGPTPLRTEVFMTL